MTAVSARTVSSVRDTAPWMIWGGVAVLTVAVVLGHGLLVAAGLIGLAGALGMLELFRRRPTATVLGVWIVAVLAPAGSVLLPGALRGLVKSLDEPLVLMLFAGTLLHRFAERPPARRYIVVPMFGLLLAGWFSAVLNEVPILPLLVGTWQAMKFWVLLFITVHLPWRREDVAMLVRLFLAVTTLVMCVAMVDLVAPSVLHAVLPVTAEGAELRFGGRAGLQSLFTHPGHFGSFATFFSVFFLARFVHTGSRRDLALAVWSIGLGLLSLRFKVILGFAGALAALAVTGPQRFLRRLGAAVLVVLVAVSLGGGILTDLAQTQIDRYLLSGDETVRGLLYTTSADIGAANFPFGEGFGRFGTGAATQFSSPVYDEYGIGDRRGLSEEIAGVRHDTTWPTVLGETGYLGMLFYIGGLAAIWLRLLRQARRTPDPQLRWLSVAAAVVLTNIFLESLGRPSFFTAITSLATALVVAPPLVIGARRDRELSGATPAAAARGDGAVPPVPRSTARSAARAAPELPE